MFIKHYEIPSSISLLTTSQAQNTITFYAADDVQYIVFIEWVNSVTNSGWQGAFSASVSGAKTWSNSSLAQTNNSGKSAYHGHSMTLVIGNNANVTCTYTNSQTTAALGRSKIDMRVWKLG